MNVLGLRNNLEASLDVIWTPEKGRAVVAYEDIDPNTFVVEYKYCELYPRDKREEMQRMHELECDTGCYIMEIQLPGGVCVCVDATQATDSFGRLINHGLPGNSKILMCAS